MPGGDTRPPVAVPTALGTMLVPAAAVAFPPPPPPPPGVNRPPVVWQKPLPAALRRYLPPEVAAAVGGAQAPLPVGAPPSEGAEVQLAAFQTGQYAQLYRLIHQHSQLLIQVGPSARGAGRCGVRPGTGGSAACSVGGRNMPARLCAALCAGPLAACSPCLLYLTSGLRGAPLVHSFPHHRCT